MRIVHLNTPFLGMSAPPFSLEMPCMGIAHAIAGEYSVMHKHMSCEMHYVKKGELDLRAGKLFRALREGMVFFMNAGVDHEQRFVCRSTVYYFPLLISQFRESGTRGRAAPGRSSSPISHLLTLSWGAVPADEGMRHNLERIRQSASRLPETTGTCPELDGCFANFMNGFALAVGRSAAPAVASSTARLPHVEGGLRQPLLRAMHCVEHDFASPLTVSSIAERACMSPRNLQRHFRSAIGLTPQEYLMEVRLRNSLDLLCETDMKIDGVMQACGFRSREHFYRYFTTRIGASPEAYRRNTSRPLRVFGD